MARILEILDRLLDKVREDNPYGLVLKGGTSLALHHLKGHRESEDLDFDVDENLNVNTEKIVDYIEELLSQMKTEGTISDFKVTKKGMAATNRYHISLIIETYKPFQSKIDLDFVRLPANLEYEGELGFYTKERMFVGKLLTYASRKEFKDLYDIAYLLKTVEPSQFPEPEKLADLVDNVLDVLENEEGLVKSYKKAFRNVDLRFKNLKENQVTDFIEKTKRDLRTFRNRLLK